MVFCRGIRLKQYPTEAHNSYFISPAWTKDRTLLRWLTASLRELIMILADRNSKCMKEDMEGIGWEQRYRFLPQCYSMWFSRSKAETYAETLGLEPRWYPVQYLYERLLFSSYR